MDGCAFFPARIFCITNKATPIQLCNNVMRTFQQWENLQIIQVYANFHFAIDFDGWKADGHVLISHFCRKASKIIILSTIGPIVYVQNQGSFELLACIFWLLLSLDVTCHAVIYCIRVDQKHQYNHYEINHINTTTAK